MFCSNTSISNPSPMKFLPSLSCMKKKIILLEISRSFLYGGVTEVAPLFLNPRTILLTAHILGRHLSLTVDN